MEGIKEYGMDKLVQIAATQLSDQLPESRRLLASWLWATSILWEIPSFEVLVKLTTHLLPHLMLMLMLVLNHGKLLPIKAFPIKCTGNPSCHLYDERGCGCGCHLYPSERRRHCWLLASGGSRCNEVVVFPSDSPFAVHGYGCSFSTSNLGFVR